ncbi:MAG: hypothetical protein IPF76_06640 [Sphingopyxis sp.]|nr:hypothetical protein [Sphingopyxis sp.]MBK6412732.1 hypothetical protein [Sphingopyxis sp.]
MTQPDLAQCLPDFAVAAMREATAVFGRQFKRYEHPDVMMTGSRRARRRPCALPGARIFGAWTPRKAKAAREGAAA